MTKLDLAFYFNLKFKLIENKKIVELEIKIFKSQITEVNCPTESSMYTIGMPTRRRNKKNGTRKAPPPFL